MITRLRKQLNGRFFKGFIILVCLLMTGVFSIPFLLKQDSVPWVFSVNGIKISQRQFDLAVHEQQERLMQFKAQYGQLSEYLLKSMNMSTDPQELAKQQLQQDALLDSLCNTVGIYPHNKTAMLLIGDDTYNWFTKNFIPEYVFNEDGTLNQFGMKAYLQRSQMTSENLYDSYSKALNRYLISGIVEITGYLPQEYVKQMSDSFSGKKSFNYVEFFVADYLKKIQQQSPSEQTLKTFFEEEKESYRIPEKRTFVQWTFDPKTYGVTVLPENIIEYYEKHKNAKFVKDQSKTTIRQIIYKGNPINKPSIADIKEELLKNPELFPEKAKLYSDDPETAQKGGLLKPFTKGTLNQAIEKAAFSLEKEGDISDVIPLSDGFALIQLVSKTPRTFFSLDQVKEEIEALIKKNLFVEQLKEALSDLSVIDFETAENFAKNHHGIRSTQTRTFNAQDQVLAKLFSLEIGKGDFFISHDSGSLFVLESIKETVIPKLDDVKDIVLRDWQEKQALVALNTDINDLRKSLKKGSLVDASVAFGYKLKNTGFLERSEEKKLKNLEKEAFPIAQMIDLAVPGTIAIGFDGKKAVFVQLEAIEPSANKSSQELKAIKASLQEQNRRQVIRGLIATLNKNAKIEYNQMMQANFEDYIF